MEKSFTRVLKLSELPAAGKKPVMVGTKPVLLCNVNGKVFAVSNVCSHNDKPLERGRVGNGWIACPTHGARFELATGKAMCLPATKPIAVYESRVVDEWIELAAEAEAAAEEPDANADSTAAPAPDSTG